VTRPHALQAILAALTFAIILNSLTSAYSAHVTASNRHASCARTDLILDSLHDVILLALTPEPGQKLTSAQVRTIASFEAKAFARIVQARC
jgi:hypothetical protein